ncbi:dexamethasone-induced protein [Chelydra serpentina]|uniref:Dexamethasone-induced protein n=1 Tax=Chelydra serpentina TaxID=8475 RepID=A0A8T1T9H6_CHESE|nr:dexamethasone-induced protein [Chelydra serpentina]
MAKGSPDPCAVLASDFTQRGVVCSKWPHRCKCQWGLLPLAEVPRTCSWDGNWRLRQRPWWGAGDRQRGHCRAPKRCKSFLPAWFVAHLKMCQDWNCGTRNCGLECSKLKGMYRRQNGRDNVTRQHQNISAVTFPQDCWIRVVTLTAVIHMQHQASLGHGLHGHFKKWCLHTLNKAFTQI